MTAIELSNIVFSYPGSATRQLDGFSVVVPSGKCTALLGPSGCAKTTVLRLIAGLEKPVSGTITMGGKVLADRGHFIEPEHRAIGMIFQDYALFPHMTVEKNVAYGLTGMPRSRVKERVGQVLELVGMADYLTRYPYQLSGGQQQRIAVARALAPDPEVLLLDEPFSNLDTNLRASVRQEIKSLLVSAGVTSVLVTHDEEDAAVLAENTVRMTAP
ncbi:ABC transporter ATP-binding protein [Corynebacterium mendelii]|uniref:ABC transporter ATP-binding protein n=1 Tax=Corynebacterium mendelii TaxID=2765362 RepID=A0A939IXD2_9CORY|nr:ABC transporter ATP-binding protein [Corynebacterium mendelii]MBN9644345.1 ABC transporter ATP-binding protein [Corynebacterium mendelii]